MIKLGASLGFSRPEDKIRSIYEEVNSVTPKKAFSLRKKYTFNDDDFSGSGGFGDFYVVGNGLGGKVMRDFRYCRESSDGYNSIFDSLREEFINLKIADKLGINVPKKLNLVLAKNEIVGYLPMLVSEDLGEFEANSPDLSDFNRFVSKEKFKYQVEKILPYLENGNTINLNDLEAKVKIEKRNNRVNGADICYTNSRWFKGDAYLIDAGKWEFKGLNY